MSIVERERVEELTAPREVTDADVLERAADLLGEFDWCQGTMGSKQRGRFCALGAIAKAGGDLGYGQVPSVHFGGDPWYEYASPLGELVRAHLLNWNDEEGRTKEEVVAALRTAAEKARES